MEASPKHTSAGIGSGAVASRLLMLQPDSVLCKLSARGSDDAFTVLYSRYRQQVFAFVFHLLDRPSARDDAEDITQEVFSKAYTAMHSKQPAGSFKNWLFTIARNRTFDAIRALKPNAIPIDTTEDVVELPTSGQSAASAAEGKQELAWLVGTVSSLPGRQREALVMRELAGVSHAQIANALNTSVPATKQLISRGRDSVHEAAHENGYRSRRLGRELAMAAPILPFVAFNFGAATSAASAATVSAGATAGASAAASGTAAATGATAAGTAASGFGGIALGTKVVATILTAAAVGGGAVVAERAVTGASPQSAAATTNSSSDGSGTSGESNVGLTGTQAKEQVAEKKRKAQAKAKRARQRSKTKRERAALRAKQKRLNAKKDALREQNVAANKGGKESSSAGKSERATSNGGGSNGGGSGNKNDSPASSKREASEPPANSNGNSGQGNSDKAKP